MSDPSCDILADMIAYEGGELYRAIQRNWASDDLDGNQIKDSWEWALIAYALCDDANAQARCVYNHNLALIRQERRYTDYLSGIEHVLAGLLMVSPEAQIFWKDNLYIDGGERLLTKAYETLSYSGEAPLLAAWGDYDGDGRLNYCAALASNTAADYVEHASGTAQDQAPDCQAPVPSETYDTVTLTLAGMYASAVDIAGPAAKLMGGNGLAYSVKRDAVLTLTAPEEIPGVGRVFAGWHLDQAGGYVFANPLRLAMVRDHTLTVAYEGRPQVTLNIAGEGEGEGESVGQIEATTSESSVVVCAGEDCPSESLWPPATIPWISGTGEIGATPASGYGFGGWWGDPNVDGSNTPTLTTALNANATVTARFVPCDGPFLAMEEDFFETCVGCPVPVWTETGDSCLGVVQEGDRRYLTTECMGTGQGSLLTRRQAFADTDVTFSYRFAPFALDEQEIRVQPRFIDPARRVAIHIKMSEIKLVNNWVDSSWFCQHQTVPVPFYSEPGVWYTAFVRTIGDQMVVWVQPEDGAIPWPDAIRVLPPVVTNGDTPLHVGAPGATNQDTLNLRVNFITQGYNNNGALQLADLKAYVWPECAQADPSYPDLTELPSFTGRVEAWPTIIDFGYVQSNPPSPPQKTITLHNAGTETASGWVHATEPFSIVGDAVYEVAAGHTATLTVRFSPTESGQVYNSKVIAVDSATNEVNVLGRSVVVSAATADIRISELAPYNTSGLRDEDGETVDWIELYNVDDMIVDLGGWSLHHTHSSVADPPWYFPAGTVISARGYLVVYASGKIPPPSSLHASFTLDEEKGGCLALRTSSDELVDQVFMGRLDRPNLSWIRVADSGTKAGADATESTNRPTPLGANKASLHTAVEAYCHRDLDGFPWYYAYPAYYWMDWDFRSDLAAMPKLCSNWLVTSLGARWNLWPDTPLTRDTLVRALTRGPEVFVYRGDGFVDELSLEGHICLSGAAGSRPTCEHEMSRNDLGSSLAGLPADYTRLAMMLCCHFGEDPLAKNALHARTLIAWRGMMTSGHNAKFDSYFWAEIYLGQSINAAFSVAQDKADREFWSAYLVSGVKPELIIDGSDDEGFSCIPRDDALP